MPDINDLAKLVIDADERYYAGDDSGLSDAAYDQLKADLNAAVAANPDQADNPDVARALTRPGTTSTTFAPVKHAEPMLSLDNVFSHDELDAWATKTAANVGSHVAFSLTEKLDGISLSLTYRNGTLVQAASRGDGVEGEILTEQARTLHSIPDVLNDPNPPTLVEVRGEVVMPIEAFEQANTDRVASGKQPFANRRNAAAGSMRQKDPAITAQRPLAFFAFALGGWDGPDKPTRDSDALDWLRRSFDVPCRAHTNVPTRKVAAIAADIESQRDHLPYDIDGVVVKVEDTNHRATLGSSSRAPNWAIALKPKAQQATTRLTGIALQVGRTGRVTPRAELDPVEVGGVTVSSATLNNASFIEAKDVRIGDVVIVQRAGDVIPEVVGPVVTERDGTQQPYTFPNNCPECDMPLDRAESADARCLNPECPVQLRARAIYWASRKIADVDGLGEGLIDRLLDADLITDVGDLLSLRRDDLLTLDRVGESLADKVLDNLQGAVERLNNDPRRILASLGIRMNGMGQARDILKHFGTVEAVLNATESQLASAEGFGPERARRLHDGLRTDRVETVLAKYQTAGINFGSTGQQHVVEAADGGVVEGTPLDGMTLVLTGALDRPRNDIKADLEALGAKVSGSVSASTTALISGDDAGSKMDKAKAKGVPVIGQDELNELLTGNRNAIPAKATA